MDTQDEVIECPCYRVCAGLGLEMKRWFARARTRARVRGAFQNGGRDA